MIEILNVRATNNPNEFIVNGLQTVNASVVAEWVNDGKEVIPAFSDEEIEEVNQSKINAESFSYLASTDWVEPYLIRHELGICIIPPESNKWVIVTKRQEARDAIK